MATNWTCDKCGSKVVTRKQDVTSLGDATRQYMDMPAYCSNAQCQNRNPAFHTFGWCSEAP